jgi:hypothetical protein
MKILILTFLLFLDTISTQDNIEKLSKEYLSRVDFVGTVFIREKSNWNRDVLVGDVRTVFKGFSYGQVAIDLKSSTFIFEENHEYLIYAAQSVNDGALQVRTFSRTNFLEKAQEDILYLNSNIDCIDKSLIHDGACLRMLSPVCGCDSKTYGNSCEARKAGVAIYSSGRCK